MMTIGPIGFLSPWLLTALVALPLIWWLLRATPPQPQKIVFPPTRIMKDLEATDHTPRRTPWWLTALRVLLAALIILALASPIVNPQNELKIAKGPIVALVDNSWAAAKNWPDQQAYLNTLIRRAIRQSRPMALVATADDGRQRQIRVEGPLQAKERAASLKPMPYAPDRRGTIRALKEGLEELEAPSIFWLSDGLDHGHASKFVAELQKLKGPDGLLTIVQAPEKSAALAIRTPNKGSSELKAEILRAHSGRQEGRVVAWSARAEQLGSTPYIFTEDAKSTLAAFDLPLELRNQVVRLQILGENTAGGIHLLDGRSQRQRIGLISGEAREVAQPLLSPLYYVDRALSPFAEIITIRDSNIANATKELLDQSPSTMIMANIGKLFGSTSEQIEKWVEAGGVLVRFAGPRLEQDGDALLPVSLRRGGRTLGGALSWSTPQSLAPFDEKSIFRGLKVSADVTVNRQVLADPAQTSANTEVWARLQDGTPLVTAARRGEGWLVLFHVTANSDWSKLPHSGLFVSMLRRITELSNFVGGAPASSPGAPNTASPETPSNDPASNYVRSEILPPIETLDGFGNLVPPTPLAEPINISKIDKIKPSAKHPPGLYGPAKAMRVINIANTSFSMRPLQPPSTGISNDTYATTEPTTLKPWALLAAFILLCVDALAVLYISGALSSVSRRFTNAQSATASILVAGLFVTVSALPLHAQGDTQTAPGNSEAFALKSALKTRLAYVITGNADVDATSHDGLDGLSRVVASRTAIEPAEPMGVNIASDELAFFPILYWPVVNTAQPLSDAVLARLDAYMKQGGLVIFDTRDHQSSFDFGNGSVQGPGQKALQRLLGKLDIPRLEPVPADHVLTKSFYLLDNFPGRWDGGTLWVEAGNQSDPEAKRRARRSDGVSSILITSNDFAAAWALNDRNRPIFPVMPGGEIQRELAFRSGINIVMYALTGNYKADQVHVPALLERLGQ